MNIYKVWVAKKWKNECEARKRSIKLSYDQETIIIMRYVYVWQTFDEFF